MREKIKKIMDEIRSDMVPPYPYAYPTRSSYVENPNIDINRIWIEEDKFTRDVINLYIHYPFCKYKCGFCNLYSIACSEKNLQDEYIEALCKNLEEYREIISKRKIKTIFLGGGTPMMISDNNIKKLIDKITDISPDWRSEIQEFCIEASPDSIVQANMTGKLQILLEVGITRINIGIQSFTQKDINIIGRDYQENVNYKAIRILHEYTVKNISTDLIAGFKGQTKEEWIFSVKALLTLNPHTISTYCLRIRPDSKFGRNNFQDENFGDYYDWYEEARKLILAAGYRQETNVRYTRLDEGGYVQQDYQFNSYPVLGIGAGARSYTNVADYIVGGSSSPKREEIEEYIRCVDQGNIKPQKAFIMNDEERVRRMLVLNLYKFNLKEVHRKYADCYDYIFMDLLQELIQEGLVEEQDDVYRLTYEGIKYRDIISWAFFSEKVCELDTAFYEEIRKGNES